MEGVTIAAVGDVSTGFEPPESAFASVMQPLRTANLRFAQVERVYSANASYPRETGMKHAGQHPRMAAAFKSVPFDVVSIASNHTGDWGAQVIEDTLETFRQLGISCAGAGRNVFAARRPAILERNGLRIAILAYTSVVEFPEYWATESQAGCAPMRAHTLYEPYESQPGAAVRVVTIPDAVDLLQLVNDVKRAKESADLVIVSFHWGVHNVSHPCDYQFTVAHTAIDAGATAVIGHHPHLMQGIELYKGSVIFYSMGNFAFWRDPIRKKGLSYCSSNERYTTKEVYSIEPDPGFLFDYHRHWNEGAIAFVDVDRRGLVAVNLVPTLMDEVGQPRVIGPDEPQFEQSRTYLNWAGKFIAGGVTNMKAVNERYQVFVRDAA